MIALPGSHDPTAAELAEHCGATAAQVRAVAALIHSHPMASGRIVREHVSDVLRAMAGQNMVMIGSPARPGLSLQRRREPDPYASPRRFPGKADPFETDRARECTCGELAIMRTFHGRDCPYRTGVGA